MAHPGRTKGVPGMASRETDKAPDRRHGQVGQEGGRHRPGAPGLTDLPAGDLRLLLNGEWEFAEGPDGDPPAAGWGRVRVPHRSREFEDDPPASGWYRTTLEVPADWEIGDRRLVLDPGRVRHFGRLHLDGRALGEHRGMRLPWRLDLTSLAGPGSVHDLLLFTHNCTGPYAHPTRTSLSEDAETALDTRFWRTSAATVGLESDVHLSLESRVRIEDVHVTTSVREGTLTADLTVRNARETPFAGQVRLRVRREGGTELELPGCAVELAPGAAQRVSASASWKDPVIWGRPPYGEPVLYFLETVLHEAGPGPAAGPAVHAEATRFGFREIWAEGDRLLLNGTRLMPWGDHTVPYVYERQWLTRKFVDLAEANVSIVEHHRYDPPSVLYDVADELGVFVVGANFCVGTGQVFPPDMEAGEKALVMEHHLAVADHWIRSARNHPSILFWDITDARDPGYCVPLLRKVKELDESRIAEVTFDPSAADAELIELIDCYRLFSSLESIEQSIETIRGELPVKPVRVGEAGIFERGSWGDDEEPPLQEGWGDFLPTMGERNIHGLQTFFLADMDYRGFQDSVPGMLAADFDFRVTWPSQSGADARIDPLLRGHARRPRQAPPQPQLVRPGAAGVAAHGHGRLVAAPLPPHRRARRGTPGQRAGAGGAGARHPRRRAGPRGLRPGGSAGGAGGPAPRRPGRPGGGGVVRPARGGGLPLHVRGLGRGRGNPQAADPGAGWVRPRAGGDPVAA